MPRGITHTIFSTECNNYFDWQAIGLAQSHSRVKMLGPITRLEACEGGPRGPERLGVRTYTHPNYGLPSNNHVQETYAPYNKAGGVVHWLESNADPPVEEFVLIVEADMLFRGPIDCESLGVRPGLAASAQYDHLKGVS